MLVPAVTFQRHRPLRKGHDAEGAEPPVSFPRDKPVYQVVEVSEVMTRTTAVIITDRRVCFASLEKRRGEGTSPNPALLIHSKRAY